MLASCSKWAGRRAVKRRAVGITEPRRWMGLVTRNWERKRFYKKVSVYKTEGGYGVRLDHRSLRTPLWEVFVVPSESLALAVAQEWNTQETFVQPALMHLTALCNTVIHQRGREEALGELLHYLSTDTLCFRASEPDDLVTLQEREWDPIVAWFNSRYSLSVQPSTSLDVPTFDPQALQPLESYLTSLDQWTFTAFEHSVESTKSLILACALFESQINADKACDLAQLEVRHQTARWGSVEWQHDVEAHDLRSRLAAALLLTGLL